VPIIEDPEPTGPRVPLTEAEQQELMEWWSAHRPPYRHTGWIKDELWHWMGWYGATVPPEDS
jgi:hypothetical protein